MTAVLDRLFLQRAWEIFFFFSTFRADAVWLYGLKHVGPCCLIILLLMLPSGDAQSSKEQVPSPGWWFIREHFSFISLTVSQFVVGCVVDGHGRRHQMASSVRKHAHRLFTTAPFTPGINIRLKRSDRERTAGAERSRLHLTPWLRLRARSFCQSSTFLSSRNVFRKCGKKIARFEKQTRREHGRKSLHPLDVR